HIGGSSCGFANYSSRLLLNNMNATKPCCAFETTEMPDGGVYCIVEESSNWGIPVLRRMALVGSSPTWASL
ncbi:MAG: hypothetical protein AAGJ35_09435, partial [Myxococcota bacterium]